MNPFIQFTNLYDFHAVVLATTFLLAAFYFLIKKRYILMTIFLILSGITKEQVWIVTSIFGFFLLFQKIKKIKILGLGIIIFSIAIFLFLVSYAIPQSLGSQHFALAYYSDFGNSPSQVIKNVIFSPQQVTSVIFEQTRLEYLKQIFMPMGFISILSPVLLIFALPDLLINLLSNNPQLYQRYYQYSATITHFIFISAIYTIKTIIKWFPKLPKLYLGIYLIFFTLLSAYLLGPLPKSKYPNTAMFTKPYPDGKIVENLLSKIPEKYSVAATNNLGAHLSHRQQLTTIPLGIANSDVILFLLNDGSAKPSLRVQRDMANTLSRDKNYIKIFMKDDFVVFKKRGILL
jgi:uncharacterized membrane protein